MKDDRRVGVLRTKGAKQLGCRSRPWLAEPDYITACCRECRPDRAFPGGGP